MKIKKSDTVLIISGKDRGKTGKVIKVLPGLRKIVVEGVNIIKKHQKPRRQGQKGEKVEIVKPIDISNAMLVCPKCGQSTRVGYKITSENKKFRICKKCQIEI